jgi:type II secretory pathway component PulK
MWARRRCRRGSMYVAVLLTAMIVAVIGISALTITRVELRSAEGAKDTIEARFYAQSALEIGSHLINGDRNWRTAYSSGVWVAEQSIGTGTYAWKLVDEQDGDLANDPSQPVRL